MRKLLRFWRGRKLRRSGFSLLDVLIGATILALALFSALALAGNNARLISQNQNVAAASLLAQNKMEEIRNATYGSILSGSDAGKLNAQGSSSSSGLYTRSWTVVANSPIANMKTVTVTVNWSQFGQARTYSLHGEVAQ